MSQYRSQMPLFIPVEIIIHILSYLREQPQPIRQNTLYSCCLVSRLWYSAALPLLYEKPYITGANFDGFTRAVCPSVQAYAPRGDLGRFVRRLDFSKLVHNLTTSLTTRYLGRVKDNVEVFIAPASGFSAINLVTLSKCKKLRSIDLLHVIRKIEFEAIKKALQHLDNLRRLRLPRSTNITTVASHLSWPPNLRTLEISGTLDRTTILTFDWPPKLSSLTLAGKALKDPALIPAVLNNSYLRTHLKSLRIPYEMHYTPQHAELLLHSIPNLHYLSIQGDLAKPPFFHTLASLPWPLPLEILAFEQSQGFPDFSKEDFLHALDGGLRNLRLLGLHESHPSRLRIVSDDELDELLRRNAQRAGHSRDEIESGDIPVGVYHFG
ncbi:F-box domain-containing protein [Histoplasma capsulatum G186AR]|uniref:F-box domain-containing protein n=2 Tax=Ajellomyces capsulatus TaxID=5037 RepID=C0NGY6_AJECG|nr:F-box domain-containing protein [Histoplasma capsulatum G186AR]EEH09071.1 F-box domain-containing protein [Histoplasma capsulatum G186AR]KAG5303615.1 F-box domain-containing protein [Histoplasma capsulatum]QSS69212.1 F-box domain-containing protein [Histoplasma capsulatum G186AR]